jgi:hypothetical protein
MDSIPFEKIALPDAKATLDGPPKRDIEKNWVAVRRQDPKNADLTEAAWQWLDALPHEIQPGGLVQRYPRITNRLAEIWGRAKQCEQYLDTLIMDNRGGREGFPLDVTVELGKLRAYYVKEIVGQRFDAWGQRIA